MKMLSLRLPKSMYGDLKEMAKAEGVSMNQFVAIAIAVWLLNDNIVDNTEHHWHQAYSTTTGLCNV